MPKEQNFYRFGIIIHTTLRFHADAKSISSGNNIALSPSLHLLKRRVFREPAVEHFVGLAFYFRGDALTHLLDGDGEGDRLIQPADDRQPLGADDVDWQHQIGQRGENHQLVSLGCLVASPVYALQTKFTIDN